MMAARDRLGGLSDQTVAAMVLMRAVFDRVLVESVGDDLGLPAAQVVLEELPEPRAIGLR